VNENAATLPSKKKVEKRGEQKKSAKKITKRRGRATFATFAFVRFVERLREIPFFLAFFFAKQQPLPSPPSPPAIGLRNHFGPHLQVRKKKRQQKKTSNALRVESGKKNGEIGENGGSGEKKILIFFLKEKAVAEFWNATHGQRYSSFGFTEFFCYRVFFTEFFFLISIEPSTHAARMTLKKMTDRP